MSAPESKPASTEVPEQLRPLMTGSRDSTNERIQGYEQRLDVHGSEPSFNEDGVDLTQIRESLRRTPYERLILVQNWVDSLQSVRAVRGPR
jgi:hypothetical protein